jgi:hypothetical protein
MNEGLITSEPGQTHLNASYQVKIAFKHLFCLEKAENALKKPGHSLAETQNQ